MWWPECAPVGVRMRGPSYQPCWGWPRRVSVPPAALVRADMSLPGVRAVRCARTVGPDFGMLVVWMNVE